MAAADIFSRLRDGVTVADEGYAVLQVGGRSGLFQIDLLTGAATARGLFDGSVVVVGLAALAPS